MEELKAELKVVLEKLQGPELIDIHHGEEQLKEKVGPRHALHHVQCCLRVCSQKEEARSRQRVMLPSGMNRSDQAAK